jgi:DNA-binding NtrC family response regulator
VAVALGLRSVTTIPARLTECHEEGPMVTPDQVEAVMARTPVPADIRPEIINSDQSGAGETSTISLDEKLLEFERELDNMGRSKQAAANKSRAAKLLRVKRSTLGDRIRHCGLESSTFA